MSIETIKEKVVNKSIQVCVARIEEIKFIIDATPCIDLLKLQRSTVLAVRQTSDPKKCLSILKGAKKKEKELGKLIALQRNTPDLIDERVKLEMELMQLRSELYFIEIRKK